MNYFRSLISKNTCLAFIFMSAMFLQGKEWKKEVLSCEEQVCFVLQGEEEAMLLGSLIWAKEAVQGGKEMRYERYFYEGISLRNEAGEELHIHGRVLEPTGLEWAAVMPGVSFSDYVQVKKGWDAEFAQTLEEKNVRYFTDEERKETQVHWVNGSLWQIGLDSEQEQISQVREGVYVFVQGDEHMYIAPKIVTKKGRIHHSSFLRGGPVRSAGKIQVDANGQIAWLNNDSGHYRPDDPEVIAALRFIQRQIPDNLFWQIWVQSKPYEAWELAPEFIRNYEAGEISEDDVLLLSSERVDKG